MSWAVAADHRTAFVRLSLTGGLFAVAMPVISGSMRGWCPWCLVLACLTIDLALTSIRPISVGIALSALPLGVALWVIVALLFSPPPRELPPVPLRPYEASIKEGLVYIAVFSDPECPHCRRLMRFVTGWLEENVPSRIVLHRWFLLPTSGARGVRAAVAVEATMLLDARLGRLYLAEVYRCDRPLTDEVLLEIADNVGARSTVAGALSSPPDAALRLVASDARLSEEIGIHEVPCVLSVSDTLTIMSSPEALYDLADPAEYRRRSTSKEET